MDCFGNLLKLRRFIEKEIGTGFKAFPAVLSVRIIGHNNDRCIRIFLFDFGQRPDPAAARHTDIQHGYIRLEGFHLLKCFQGIHRLGHFYMRKSRKPVNQPFADRLRIICNKHLHSRRRVLLIYRMKTSGLSFFSCKKKPYATAEWFLQSAFPRPEYFQYAAPLRAPQYVRAYRAVRKTSVSARHPDPYRIRYRRSKN